MGAVISACGRYRYRLDRHVYMNGLTFLFAGVNPSTADAELEDQTTMKWHGFVLRNGGGRYVAVNPFAYRATDVRELARVPDPVGPDNAVHVDAAIAEADVLVPCWGDTRKVPKALRYRFKDLLRQMRLSGKPVRTFGFTLGGDPRHPLMLPYSTKLQEWA